MKLSIKSISLLLVLAIIIFISFLVYENYLDEDYQKSRIIANKCTETPDINNKEDINSDNNLEKRTYSFITRLEEVSEKSNIKNQEEIPLPEKESTTSENVNILDASYKELNFPHLALKDSEPKKYYKESIIYNGKTILYIGSENKLESVKRIVDIAANFENVVNQEIRRGKAKIITRIKKSGDDYIIQVNKNDVLTVKDIDAKINNESKEKLAKIWQQNIETVLTEYVKYKRPQTFNDSVIYIFINLILLLIIAGILELFKLISDRYMNLAVTKVVKTCNKMVKRFKAKETAHERAVFASEIKEKIELISNQACHVITILFRIIQLFLLFVFIVAIMYNIPETYIYIKGIAHYIISAFLLYTSEYCYWLFADSTWKHVFDILIIIICSIIVIYIVKILESIVINLIQVVMSDIKSKGKRFQTITKIISTTLKIVILLFAGFAIIASLKVNMTPILTGAGIAGIAISFAGQSLLKDVINGIFILFEDQFGIGDVIKIGDKSGTVEDMTLRITVLRDLSGIVHIIPNSQIFYVSVYTKDWSRAHLDISISYKDDINKAIEIIYKTANSLKKDYPDKITGDAKVLGVNNLNNSSVDIKLIIETSPGDQWLIEREFRKRIKYAFDNNNIEIPFPHMTIYKGCIDTNKAEFNQPNSPSE